MLTTFGAACAPDCHRRLRLAFWHPLPVAILLATDRYAIFCCQIVAILDALTFDFVRLWMLLYEGNKIHPGFSRPA